MTRLGLAGVGWFSPPETLEGSSFGWVEQASISASSYYTLISADWNRVSQSCCGCIAVIYNFVPFIQQSTTFSRCLAHVFWLDWHGRPGLLDLECMCQCMTVQPRLALHQAPLKPSALCLLRTCLQNLANLPFTCFKYLDDALAAWHISSASHALNSANPLPQAKT